MICERRLSNDSIAFFYYNHSNLNEQNKYAAKYTPQEVGGGGGGGEELLHQKLITKTFKTEPISFTDVLWDISDLPFVQNKIEKKTLASL